MLVSNAYAIDRLRKRSARARPQSSPMHHKTPQHACACERAPPDAPPPRWQVHSIAPNRVVTAGKVNVVCFDKTARPAAPPAAP